MREDLLKQIEIKYGRAYANSLKFTMNAEGLFANHPDDKGGMTYQGIARVYNDRWEGWQIIDKYLQQFPELNIPFKKPPVSVERLNKILSEDSTLGMLVFDYYYANYFVKSGAKSISEYSQKIAIIMFDIATLQGIRRAGKTLQRLLNRYYNANLVVDGDFGKNSLNALVDNLQNPKIGEEELTSQLLLEMSDNLVEASKLNGNIVFLKGWMARTQNLRNYLRLLK